MTDALVLNCVVSQNRPFNTQLVADLLATKGVKKPAAQRSLDALAASGKLRMKEFGKTKIYYPNQDTVVLGNEELVQKRTQTTQLNAELATLKQQVTTSKKDLASLQNAATVEQLRVLVSKVRSEVAKLEEYLKPLRTGTMVISKEESDALEKMFSEYMSAWQRRKRMFNDVWGTIADGMTRKEADIFDEVGVDTDEAAKVSYRDFSHLLPPPMKRRR